MFGLGVYRPRRFESNILMLAGQAARPSFPIGVYGTKPDGQTTYRYRNNGNYKGKSLIRAAKSIEEAREAMGIDWMTWEEIREAIPPAYTEWIGAHLLEYMAVRA
jgi:DNA (cytosine-5)-methyltransferase 1